MTSNEGCSTLYCLCHDPSSDYKTRNDQHQRGHRQANTDDQSCFQDESFFVERGLQRRPPLRHSHQPERGWHQGL